MSRWLSTLLLVALPRAQLGLSHTKWLAGALVCWGPPKCPHDSRGLQFELYYRPATHLEAITIRAKAIANRLEAMAIRLEAMAIRLEAIATSLEAILLFLRRTLELSQTLGWNGQC